MNRKKVRLKYYVPTVLFVIIGETKNKRRKNATETNQRGKK